MKKIILSFWLCVICVMNVYSQWNCMSYDIPLEVRLKEAELIVSAEVEKQICTFDDDEKSIYTLNKFRIFNSVSTLNPIDSIWVVTEGGQVGQMGRTVYGSAKIFLGQRGTFLLKKEGNLTFKKVIEAPIYRIAFEALGIIPESTNQTEQIIKRSNIFIDSFSPLEIVGGMQEITILGKGFGASRGNSFVSFTTDGSNYFTSTQAQNFDYKVWTDNKIVLEMPQAFSGKVRVHVGSDEGESSGVLKVKANIGTVSLNPRDYFYLVNQNQSGGYTWNIHGSLYKDPEAIRCIEGVFKEFRCKTGVNYKLTRTPVWVGANLGDGINSILYDSTGYELPNGVVAYYEQLWYSCILGGYTFYYVYGQELRISRKFNYYFGKGKIPQGKNAKLSYVLFHELGHSLQLGHVNEDGESMHPVVQNLPADLWNERDTLSKYDVLAGKHMVDLSRSFTFRACNVNPMSSIVQCENIYEESNLIASQVNYKKLLVLPNPSFGNAVLANLGDDITEIKIIDNSGRMVSEFVTEQDSIELPSLSMGNYILMVQNKKGIRNCRWVSMGN